MEPIKTLYVSKHGNDNNPGTEEEPLLTLQAAMGVKQIEPHPWGCPECSESTEWQCWSAINVQGIGQKKFKARFKKFPANPPLIGVSAKELKELREHPTQVHFDVCMNCGCVVS